MLRIRRGRRKRRPKVAKNREFLKYCKAKRHHPYMKLTVEYLREVLNYDPLTGIFRWKKHRKIPAGTLAGAVNSGGYLQISLMNKVYIAHRLAWMYVYGEWPSSQIDHRDRNRKNNSIKNLRLATNTQNGLNRGVQRNTKTGLKGAYLAKGGYGYVSKLRVNGKPMYLGSFRTAEAAHEAYVRASRKHHGEFSGV